MAWIQPSVAEVGQIGRDRSNLAVADLNLVGPGPNLAESGPGLAEIRQHRPKSSQRQSNPGHRWPKSARDLVDVQPKLPEIVPSSGQIWQGATCKSLNYVHVLLNEGSKITIVPPIWLARFWQKPDNSSSKFPHDPVNMAKGRLRITLHTD